MGLHSDFGERTINELMLMFRHKQINLNPGFQRQSVWSYADRRRLIQSIIASCPVPSIFLYRRNNRGKLMYDVIDGKQRLETLFMFARQGRFKRNSFDVKLDLGDGEEWQNWRDLIRYFPQTRNVFESYKIPTVEVDGDFNEIVRSVCSDKLNW